MALSNWDSLIINPEGESAYRLPYGELYKNYLHFGDGNTMNHGDISFGGYSIEAIRGPQSAIFFYMNHYADPSPWAGIGCYGYLGYLEWIKKTCPEELDKLDRKYLDDDYYRIESLTLGQDEASYIMFSFYEVGKYDLIHSFCVNKDPSLEELWIGIDKTTYKKFLFWLGELHGNDKHKKWMEKVKTNTHTRFNSGDKYFADHLGENTPSTEVGKSEPPVINQLIKGMKCDS